MDIQVIARAGRIVGILLILVSGIQIARSETTLAPPAENSVTNNTNVAAQSSTTPAEVVSITKRYDPTSNIEQLVQLQAQKRAMCQDWVVALDAGGKPDPTLKAMLCNNEPAKLPPASYMKKAVEIGKPSTVLAVSLKNWQLTNTPESEAKLVQNLINNGIEEAAAKPFVTTALNAARSSVGKRVQAFVLASSATAIVFEFLNDDDESMANQAVQDLTSGKTLQEIVAERSVREAEISHRRWMRWGIVIGAGLIGVVVYSALKGRVFS